MARPGGRRAPARPAGSTPAARRPRPSSAGGSATAALDGQGIAHSCGGPETALYRYATTGSAPTAFAESDLGKRYPATVTTWENAWERFIPFLAFPPELRRIIYTTNSIESLNYQLRKIIKNRGHFPNDDAVIKLLWLAIRDIEDKRARQRAKEKGAPRDQRKAPGRLVEGAAVHGWKQALGALALAYPDRLAPYLS